jgi:hypothetical protein
VETRGADSEEHHNFNNTVRFVALQHAARHLASRLEREYVVERSDGPDLTPFIESNWPGANATRLQPDTGAAAMAFVFGDDAFPGVDLTYGFAGRSLFPGCFCDECNESVDENAQRMLDVVDSVVAGRFVERRVRRVFAHDQYHNDRIGAAYRVATTEQLDASLRAVMPRGEIIWRAWTPVSATLP